MDAGSDIVCQFSSDRLWWWSGINNAEINWKSGNVVWDKNKTHYVPHHTGQTPGVYATYYDGTIVFSYHLTQVMKVIPVKNIEVKDPEMFLSASIYTFSRWLIPSKMKKRSSIFLSRPNLWPTFTISTSQIGKQSTIQLDLTWPWKTMLFIPPLWNPQTRSLDTEYGFAHR